MISSFDFGRKMEGMWLPETAVDIETLEIMAEQGVLFTILAPSQASRVRGIDESEWHDVSGAKIDPTMAYRLGLPSGRSLSLFFYDGPISLAVAFEGLLNDGEAFANRILGAFNDDRAWAQIAHIATDGEGYGHHHRNGDMALAYALDYIESHDLAKVTNYGEFLEKYPPSHEVEIFENTSWSCIHGIERWSADCGCNSGGYPDWNQAWRATTQSDAGLAERFAGSRIPRIGRQARKRPLGSKKWLHRCGNGSITRVHRAIHWPTRGPRLQ